MKVFALGACGRSYLCLRGGGRIEVESVENRASVERAVPGAGVCHFLERLLHALKVANLGLDVTQSDLGMPLHVRP